MEEVNSLDSISTAVIITGGPLAGPRDSGTTKNGGIALKQFIDRNNLFVASHRQLSYGPSHTYHFGDKFTTVDNVLTNKAACGLLIEAHGEPHHALNVSDHLHLSVYLGSHPSSRT